MAGFEGSMCIKTDHCNGEKCFPISTTNDSGVPLSTRTASRNTLNSRSYFYLLSVKDLRRKENKVLSCSRFGGLTSAWSIFKKLSMIIFSERSPRGPEKSSTFTMLVTKAKIPTCEVPHCLCHRRNNFIYKSVPLSEIRFFTGHNRG